MRVTSKTILLLALVAISLTACTEGSGATAETDPPGTTDSSAISDTPAIYVEQTRLSVVDGRPHIESGYKGMLEVCRNAGVPTTPLSAEEVRKIGRTYYKIWYEGDRLAIREDQWGYKKTGDGFSSCDFKVTHSAGMLITTGDEQYSVDLTAKTGTRRAIPPVAGEGLPPEDLELLQGRGFQMLGKASANGQHCLRWRDPHGNESCTWNEGRQWGFSRQQGTDDVFGNADARSIVLWVHPANGTGGKLTTQQMRVGGKTFDDSVFEPPGNVAIEAIGP